MFGGAQLRDALAPGGAGRAAGDLVAAARDAAGAAARGVSAAAPAARACRAPKKRRRARRWWLLAAAPDGGGARSSSRWPSRSIGDAARSRRATARWCCSSTMAGRRRMPGRRARPRSPMRWRGAARDEPRRRHRADRQRIAPQTSACSMPARRSAAPRELAPEALAAGPHGARSAALAKTQIRRASRRSCGSATGSITAMRRRSPPRCRRSATCTLYADAPGKVPLALKPERNDDRRLQARP